MKLAIVLGLALALSAQAPKRICPNRTLDGHWWLAASHCDRALYLQAYSDGGRTLGTDAEAAIDRFYSTPQQFYGRAEQFVFINGTLNLPLRQVIRHIWGSADKVARPSLQPLK